jgi:hypothetical protein
MLRDIGNRVFLFLKTTLKKYLGPVRYRKLYIRYYIFISAFYIMTNSINRVLFRRIFIHDKKLKQKYISWDTNFPSFTDYQFFRQFLDEAHIYYYEGGCTLYIPPQPNLERYFGEMVDFYPSDAGFKILKDFSSPDQANYLKYNKEVCWQEVKLVSSASELLNVACTLETLGLGARVYDLCQLKAHETQMTCFIVQHIASQEVTTEDVNNFLKRLDTPSVKNILGTVVPYKRNPHSDFLPPNCNNNLVKDDQGRMFYIDFQQFGILNPTKLPAQIVNSESGKLSFGDVNFLRSKKPYLYQTIPGIKIAARRDTITRWEKIKNILTDAEITVDSRLILDICCNTGMMLSMALSEGALWGLGWDLPVVAETALQLQRSLGFSRIDIIKANLAADYSIQADINERFIPHLNESIVFYLAAYDHVGLIFELSKIPWRVLFFEGHEAVNHDDYVTVTNFLTKEGQSHLIRETMMQDGDSQPRRLFMYMR